VPGFVERIYVASGAGAPVERVGEVAAIEGCGLAGDRYCEGTGHWSRFGKVCQVTLIAAEDLDAIEKETGIRVRDGEHRLNVVLRGVNLGGLRRRRFRIGGAILEYARPRSVCRYVVQYSHEPNIAVARAWVHVFGLEMTEERKLTLANKLKLGYDALGVMERHLAGDDFFVGGRYTAADIALYAYTHVAHEGDFDLAGYPAVRTGMGRFAAQPGHVPITQG
jgi:hypothetical protein